jgi:hypothetical protein
MGDLRGRSVERLEEQEQLSALAASGSLPDAMVARALKHKDFHPFRAQSPSDASLAEFRELIL